MTRAQCAQSLYPQNKFDKRSNTKYKHNCWNISKICYLIPRQPWKQLLHISPPYCFGRTNTRLLATSLIVKIENYKRNWHYLVVFPVSWPTSALLFDWRPTVKFRKYESPRAYIFQRPFLRCLYLEGLIHEGPYFRNFTVFCFIAFS